VRIAVAGLGLIGGSLARELTRLGHHVTGTDVQPDSIRAALDAGAIAAVADDRAFRDADVVILAIPVDGTAAWLRELAPALEQCRLIMDTGSVKAAPVAAAAAAGLADRFIGAHPMAGNHGAGFGASRTGLFAGARTYLCAGPGVRSECMPLAEELWRSVGSEPERIDAAEHDALLAFTSHMPQFAATALALVLERYGTTPAQLGPGGRDMMRLAGSDPAIWRAIALHNRRALGKAIDALQAELAGLRAAIEAGDSNALVARLATARDWWRRDAAPLPQ
jgi:prephenate dehydrogenase